MKLKLFALTFLWLISFNTYADVYEYIDEEGNIHLTDAPADARYVLIVKTEEVVAPLPTTNAIENNLGNDAHALSLSPPQLLAQVEQSAQNNQLDSELVHAVMYVESAYKVNAKSRKGAQGLMQLMPATAKRFGVKNSRDPAQNIEGGAKYLRELLTLFKNDVSLALAAYNAGEHAVIKHGNKIPPYKETQAYVPKVLGVYQALLKQRKQIM